LFEQNVNTGGLIMDMVKEWISVHMAIIKAVSVVLVVVFAIIWMRHNPPEEVGDKNAQNAVILLHGYGADKNDLVPLANTLQKELPDTRFIMPQAPHSISTGYSWIPSFSESTQEAADKKQNEYRAEARELVIDIVDDVISDGVDPRNIFIGGFSQGAAVALDVILNEPDAAQVGGLIYMSGGGFKLDYSKLSNRTTFRAFVSHANRDPRVNVDQAKKLVEALKENGTNVKYVLFDQGHTITADVISELKVFLKNSM
jgi:phospholipase/carboxylesterase